MAVELVLPPVPGAPRGWAGRFWPVRGTVAQAGPDFGYGCLERSGLTHILLTYRGYEEPLASAARSVQD